jgi:hypothetical protein
MVAITRRNLALAAWWAGAATLVFFGGRALERRGEQPIPGEPSEAQLRVPFSYAQSAMGGRPVDQAVVFHRGQAVGMHGDFKTSSTATEVVERMEQTFLSQGWVLREKLHTNAGLVYVKFCHQGIATIADSRPRARPNEYYIASIWAMDPDHYAYCEK